MQPEDANAHYNLGLAYDNKGLVDEAVQQLRETIRLKPDDANAHYNLGVILGKEGPAQGSHRRVQHRRAPPAGLCRGIL